MLLNGVLALHDIHDVEAFCTHIIQQRHLTLNHHQHEDLLTTLIETTYELSLNYKPGRTIRFSTYAGTILRQRLTDNIRNTNGRTVWKFSDRTYTRTLPQLVSYEHETGNTNHQPTRRMAHAIANQPSNSTADSTTTLNGLLTPGHSNTSRDLHLIRQAATQPTRRRT